MGKVSIIVLVSMLLMFLPEKCISMPKSNFTDQSALLAFKDHITFDPGNILARNWSSKTSFCNWMGVLCSPGRQRVTALNLPNIGLIGTIPPQLGKLSFLQSLNLYNNSFHGNLPSELGKLRRLNSMDMRFNNFSGVVPESFGNLHQLQHLRFNTNSITGEIPSSIFNISSLQVIDLTFNRVVGSLPKNMCDHLPKLEMLLLSDNQLTGQIPSELSRCRGLQSLSLSNNDLGGAIPEGIGFLPMLNSLNLSNNILSGVLPQSIFNVTAIKSIDLSSNNLSGSIPHIGNLPNLKDLNLQSNDLTGLIPATIFNFSSLREVSLGSNILSGGLPMDLCHHLPLLEVLVLQQNHLSGQIPPSLCKCEKLQEISMTDNNFTGNLPGDIGNLSMLIDLSFGRNMLSGPIPRSLANLSKLEFLDLSYNNIHGNSLQELGNLRALKELRLESNSFTNDPASSQELSFFTSLTNCRELEVLRIGNNPLNGMLPNSIGNLSSSLVTFQIPNSKLKGNIPREIANLSNLIDLTLNVNNLTGSIPTVGGLGKIQLVFLQVNKLSGSIPYDICLARNLAKLALDRNNLSGEIPNCIGNLTSLRRIYLNSNALSSTIPLTLWRLEDLVVLNLSSNSLKGSLPLQVGGMKAATAIYLSRNQLSGDIPRTVGSLQSLINISLSSNSFQGSIPEGFGDLVSLEFLDLSQNNLSGMIPKSLEKLRYLKYLNVSFNGLQGEIPSGGQFSNFTAQSFMRNKALCGHSQLQVPPCHSKSHRSSKTKSRILRFGLPAIGSLLLVLAFIGLVIGCRRRHRKSPIPEALPLTTAIQRRISYLELRRATNEFQESNLLGVGSFGSVYQGMLPDGLNVAVKTFNLQLQGGFKSFDTECEIMRNIRHRNLVKIICSCSNIDFKALVLEYMPKGSLEKWLYSYNYCLEIIQRVNIMIDVASALEYLHHGHSTPVVHCDLKPSNVLLDEDMVAHVCDFGIAKLLGGSESFVQTKTLATIGYMAPEYGLDGLVSTKIDVYSFGIMLMEIFTRKKPTDEMFEGEMSLKRLVKESFPDSIIDIVDSNMLNRGDSYSNKEQCVTSIMELALQCTNESPEERINMVEILARLKKIKEQFLRDRQRQST